MPFKSGILPEKCIPFDFVTAMDFDKFQANLQEALADLKSGFEVIFVYYGKVDKLGHIHGPDSSEVIEEIIKVDGAIGQFMENLAADGFGSNTNVIITSDHGI